MKCLKIILAIFSVVSLRTVEAEQTKTTFNPYTGKFDFITALSTSSIAAGSGIVVSTTSSGVTISASGASASNLAVNQSGVQVSSPTSALNFIGPPFSVTQVGGTTAQITLNASSVTLQGQNVIDLTSTLQSGATFYVSSGTVNGGLNVQSLGNTGGNFNLSNPTSGANAAGSLLWYGDSQGMTAVSGAGFVVDVNRGPALRFTSAYTGNGTTGSPVFVAKLLNGVPYVIIATSDTATTGVLAFHGTNSGASQYVGLTSSAGVNLNGTVWSLPASDGSSGQALVTDGSSHLSFAATSGTGLLSSTNTWTGQNTWTTLAQSTFTYGVAVGSLTVSNATTGNLSVTENSVTGQIVLSTAGTGVTVGHCAQFGSSMTVVDAGASCGTGSGGGSGGLVSLSTGIITPAVFGASVTANYGMTTSSLTIYSITQSSQALVVMSTNSTPVLAVDNGVYSLTPGQIQIAITSSTLSTAATFFSLTTTGDEVITGSITTNGIVGTIAGGNACTGCVGEYISSVTASATAFPGTGNYGDLVAVILSSGDWDVTAVLGSQANGATVTTMAIGISTTTGNTTANLNEGDNYVKSLGPTAATDTFAVIPSYRVSSASTKTYYLKYEGGFSIATPNAVGRLSARRIR